MRKRSSSAESWASSCGLQVVRHQEVAAGEADRRPALGPARPDRQRGEVEARGPALGVRGELGDLVIGQIHAGRSQQLARLLGVHAQVLGAEFQLQSPRPQRAERQGGRAASRQGELLAVANVPRKRGHRIERCAVMEQVQVVQDQHERLRDRGQRCAQSRHDRPLDRHARATSGPRTPSRRSAKRDRGRSPRRSAGRSDRCPSRRRAPRRTTAGSAPPTRPARSSSPNPDRRTGTRPEPLLRPPGARSAHRVTRSRRDPAAAAASTPAARTAARAARGRCASAAPARTSQTGSPHVQPTIRHELTRRSPGELDGRSLTATVRVPCPPETRAETTLSDPPPECQGCLATGWCVAVGELRTRLNRHRLGATFA